MGGCPFASAEPTGLAGSNRVCVMAGSRAEAGQNGRGKRGGQCHPPLPPPSISLPAGFKAGVGEASRGRQRTGCRAWDTTARDPPYPMPRALGPARDREGTKRGSRAKCAQESRGAGSPPRARSRHGVPSHRVSSTRGTSSQMTSCLGSRKVAIMKKTI